MAEYETLKGRTHFSWAQETTWEEPSEWLGLPHDRWIQRQLRWREARFEEERAKNVLEMVKSELDKFRTELQGLQQLQRKLETGRVVLIETEPLALPSFPPEEIESCKIQILAELDANGEAFPSDIAEKYDLDMRLVLVCFNQLAKEGKIEAVV